MRAIVERAMRGEREAFGELVNATSDRMYAVATRILRDADLAEDAVQGALITAWRELPGLRDPDRFEAWVRRLVVHACHAEARRRGRWTANVRVLPVDGPAGPDEILSVHDRDALDRAFRRLGDVDRHGVPLRMTTEPKARRPPARSAARSAYAVREMTATMHLRVLGTAALAVVLAACSGAPPTASPTAQPASQPPPSIPAPTSASDLVREPGVLRGHVDVGGASVWIECLGTGSPTVIMETGLGSGSGNWIDSQRALASTTRVCRYDRVAIGQSDGPGVQTITAGTRADELYGLLQAAQIEGPYVLVGWSFGGMIVRLFAARHLDETAGLVLVDSSHEDQIVDPWFTAQMSAWSDGPFRIIDGERSRAELLASTDLGAAPTIVLTQGRLNGDFERHWAPLQDALATISMSSLHLVATKAGHDINYDAPELSRKAIEAVIVAARTGKPLPACVGTFDAVGATCLDGTLVERLAAWDALRAGVQAHAGGFPDGTYRMDLTGDQAEAATGEPQDFRVAVHTWTIAVGHWKVSIRFDDDLEREVHEGVFDADGSTVTFLLPDDWRIGGTPGINELTWAVDAMGTITFKQTDAYLIEPSFLAPWVPIAG